MGGGHFGGTPHVSAPPPAVPHPVMPPRPVMPQPRTMNPPARPLTVAPAFRFPPPIRPVPPIRRGLPIVSAPIYFYPPFPGFGFGSLGWPHCSPFWGWGGDFDCFGSPYLNYYGGPYSGYFGDYGLAYGQSVLGDQQGYAPQTYQGPPILYGGQQRQFVQLYLKDGTIYDVTDYWLVDNQVHFTTAEEGGQQSVAGVIGLDELDLQRTIDVNTQRGFRFVLRNEPIEQYLQDHPDAGSLDSAAPGGPVGPLTPAPAQP
jgi:hypothetical protein